MCVLLLPGNVCGLNDVRSDWLVGLGFAWSGRVAQLASRCQKEIERALFLRPKREAAQYKETMPRNQDFFFLFSSLFLFCRVGGGEY